MIHIGQLVDIVPIRLQRAIFRNVIGGQGREPTGERNSIDVQQLLPSVCELVSGQQGLVWYS